MSTDTPIDPLALAGAKSKGKRPWFLKDNDTERLMTVVMTLAQEVAVLRERLDTVERLLERGEGVSRSSIEAYVPTKDEAAERGAWMQEFLARLLRVLQHDRESLVAREQANEDLADELAKN